VPLGVDGDPARLQQVIGNLLSNAARYSPPGSRIWLTARGLDDCILLTVKDEGCGIQRDMLSEIFELFVQADQGLDRPRGGLGVGLTLVRKIVELHGGTVEARSDGPGRAASWWCACRARRCSRPPRRGPGRRPRAADGAS
jgi:signal transduction histidine kinase